MANEISKYPDHAPMFNEVPLPAGILTPEQEAKWLENFNTSFKDRENAKLGAEAVVKTLAKVSVIAKLNNGTKDGKVQTVNLSLGDLSEDRYDDQKAMNIVDLLRPCLDKEVYETQEVKTSVLKNS